MQGAVAGTPLSVKDTEHKRQHEKNSRKPAGKFDQYVGGLGAEYILSHASAESGAKTLAFRPLHQDDQGHQQCNQHVDGKENVDEDVHFREAGIWLNTSKWQTHKERQRRTPDWLVIESFVIFYLFPNRVQFLQTRVAEFSVARPQSIFHFVETRDEFIGRSLKQTLSIELTFPRQIGHRK